MSRKTESAYTAVLNYISNNIVDKQNTAVIMTDFETAERNACKTAFPDAYLAGCFTHYERVKIIFKILHFTLHHLHN